MSKPRATALFIGGSHDGRTLPEPPGGFLPKFRVRKKMTWVEEMNTPEPADSIETYELRRFGFSADEKTLGIYEVYAVEGIKQTFTGAELHRIGERLYGIKPLYTKTLEVEEL
jgi:hypothetical protein